MLLALALIAATSIAPRGPDEETLIHFLAYGTPLATGALSCDKAERREQEAAFHQRFDARLRRLTAAYVAVNGADAPIEILAILRCTRSDDPDRIDAAFEKGMRAFDARLRVFERRYGTRR